MRRATLLLLLLLAAAPAAAQDQFTAEERRLLLAGELVRRDLSHREGARSLYGGASWQRVEAPIDRVWETALDPRALTRLIPSLDEARVVEEHVDGARISRVLYMHHSYGFAETAYYVRMELDGATRSLELHLDASRPHDIRSGRGFLSLSPYRGGTIVSWGMLVDPGAGVVTQLFGPMLNEWLLLPPRCMRDEVEPGRGSTC
jgi:hypothetical protein